MTEENAYKSIERYAKSENVSGMALLLDGEWGSGKSYFVNTVVKDRLKAHKIKCVTVSLYGITEVSQISVQIYTQLRSIKMFKNEAAQTASIVASHVLGSLISKQGMTLTGISNNEYKKLFQSMDLKNTLIVFDDVERCKIDIIEVLAYVNNLCEQGKAKVLIVTNEKELINYIKDDKPFRPQHKTRNDIINEELFRSLDNPSEKCELTPSTEKYLSMKEKTIGDTIHFSPDYKHIINFIIFKHNVFSDMEPVYGKERIVNYISIMMNALNIHNMRSLEYACDKIDNILYDKVLTKDNSEFYYNVIFSTMCFILCSRISGYKDWVSSNIDNRISSYTCSEEFPLPLFIYKFLKEDEVNTIDMAFVEVFNHACDSCKSESCTSRFWKENEVKA